MIFQNYEKQYMKNFFESLSDGFRFKRKNNYITVVKFIKRGVEKCQI